MRFLKKGDKKKTEIPVGDSDKSTPRLKGSYRGTNFGSAIPTAGSSPTATTATKHHITEYQV